MKIVIIGGNGTIGSYVSEYFKTTDEVIVAGRNSGDIQVDIADTASLEKLFQSVSNIDAVICIAGEARWADFSELSEEDYYIGIKSKLMGQVNLTRLAAASLNPGGVITLSTGILADDPVLKTASAAMVNGGIHSFARATALELKRGIRLNVVSLGMVAAAYDKYKGYFPGHNPVPMNKAVNAYVRSVKGRGNGEIIRVYEQ
ncbi:Short chain dehydrogenase [Tenacibaculum litopenaei]|uniref:short chain dehydrogenase n=1 Tax=Tenacibaculum litopenaei TaxID=396016 RepID=UPI0038932CFD